MPRPKTKEELLALSQENYDKLNSFIDQYTLEEQLTEFSSQTLNRNIRDVLAHLHHWHLMLLGWYTVGLTGEKPDIPAKGYTWKTLPELNKWIWKNYIDTDLKEAKTMFHSSHEQIKECH